jgi:hypothetical protein
MPTKKACAVCGRDDIPVEYCPICKTNVCNGCRRRILARAKAATSNLFTGHWRDEKGNVRKQETGG